MEPKEMLEMVNLLVKFIAAVDKGDIVASEAKEAAVHGAREVLYATAAEISAQMDSIANGNII